MNFPLSGEPAQNILDAVGENLFVADREFNIIYINKYADGLIETLIPFTGLKSRSDYIGKNMCEFHQQGLNDRIHSVLMQYTSWPYETTINIFEQYTASISISPYEWNGERQGYLLTWKDVTRYENVLREDNHRLETMFLPVLDTTIDETLLVPIVGYIDESRLEKMKQIVLESCEQKRPRKIIFDFSGFSTMYSDEKVVPGMIQFRVVLLLLGIEVILSGIHSSVATRLAQYEGFTTDVKIFPTFKHAIHYVWDSEGLEVVKKKK